jgi:hypothetical protein
VSFAAITLCVASHLVFIVVGLYFVMTQSGNFWIRPRTSQTVDTVEHNYGVMIQAPAQNFYVSIINDVVSTTDLMYCVMMSI